MGNAYNSLGIAAHGQGDLQLSIDSYSKAVETLEKADHASSADLYNTIGNLALVCYEAKDLARAEQMAAALSPFLTGPDQVVAVAMSQDNWQIVAAHLGVLKAGGILLVLDTTLPSALITHMLEDAQPVVILTRGQARFRDLPTLDVLMLPESMPPREPPRWLDDPTQRLEVLGFGGDLDAAFREWSGRENLEERVNGIQRIDPVVLEELRSR